MSILGEKIYVLTSPELIQASFRNKDLSFEEFFFGSMGLLAGISDKCKAVLTGPELRDSYTHAFTTSLSRENLLEMNVSALRVATEELDKLPNELLVDNFCLWLRDLMTLATTTALFGSKNPFLGDPDIVAGFW